MLPTFRSQALLALLDNFPGKFEPLQAMTISQFTTTGKT